MRAPFLALTALLFGTLAAHGETISVRPGSLQGAIDRAPAGATLELAAGTFAGPIVIERPVRLVGAGPATTRIELDERGTVVTIRSGADGSSLRGLCIAGGTTGVSIEEASVDMVDCWIEGAAFYGLDARQVLKGEFRRLLCKDNGAGALVRGGSKPLFRRCTFRGNDTGLTVQNAFPILRGCRIMHNDVGLRAQGIARPVLAGTTDPNVFKSNASFHVLNESRMPIDATRNRWDDAACANEDAIAGDVDWLPFVDAMGDVHDACP